ncbi:MAG: hypothetical protein Q4D97_00210 [Eubacteriales bacterium]|nr:hypothetical protein [Eubacteriales bacterium]
MGNHKQNVPVGYKQKISPETYVCLGLILLIFGFLSYKLGAVTLMQTIMQLSFDLLINTCLFLMAICVIMGGLAAILAEFGIIDLFNVILSPLMKPLYHLPGSAALGVITTFFSDNPAILSLTANASFRSGFQRYQLPALCNLGTSFGMGMVVITYMAALEIANIGAAVLAGFLGAFVGSIISTRLMLRATRNFYGDQAEDSLVDPDFQESGLHKLRKVRPGNAFQRVMDALLEGGKSGVEIGLAIIPGVVIICTLVILFTNGPEDKFPGVALIPWVGDKLNFIIQPLFGFTSPQALSVPLTALGSAGASLALVPVLVNKALIAANDVAVFTAICMCWSGYLSTHIAMMDSLKARDLASKAILSHTVGGLGAGIAANFLFKLFTSL